MTLTPEARKKKLGHGGLSKVARRLNVTAGHVTEVNAERRQDERVQREITRGILKRHPEIDPSEVWPAKDAASVTAAVGGM